MKTFIYIYIRANSRGNIVKILTPLLHEGNCYDVVNFIYMM